jgi:eukaryotic-like serine/threonine-protein kinase
MPKIIVKYMETQFSPTKICPICGAHNLISNTICSECHSSFVKNSIHFCPSCNHENSPNSKFCSACGDSLLHKAQVQDSDFSIISHAVKDEIRLERLIGEGGMGKVFLGTQLNLNRKIAIKILKMELVGSPEYINRFKNEALILAKLKSPYIIDIMNIKEVNGRPFYIMNYIDGNTLYNKIKELHSNNPKKDISSIAISIIIKLLNALRVAHRENVVHRDIKSQNILLDLENNPYLIDFGISKMRSNQSHTMDGISLGTPGYMSPEQIEGRDIDLRTDIYSTGILLFELLTGRLPFEFESIHELIRKQSSQPFPKIQDFIEGLTTTHFQTIIEKACNTNQELRYKSAEEMEAELKKISSEYSYIFSSDSKNEVPLKQDKSQLKELISTNFSMQFRLIYPGIFDMGALLKDKDSKRNEKPRVKIKIDSPFYVSTTPITQKVYSEITGKKPSKFLNPDSPVENVSYFDALKFLDLLNKNPNSMKENLPGIYRLPTEPEWEYLARGGTNWIYTFGDDKYQLDTYAYYLENSNSTTNPVAQKKPNSLGIYDLMGNVWEWCQDYYDNELLEKKDEDSSYLPKNGKYRVVRGGSFKDLAINLRLSARMGYLPEERTEHIGFRIIYELK